MVVRSEAYSTGILRCYLEVNSLAVDRKEAYSVGILRPTDSSVVDLKA